MSMRDKRDLAGLRRRIEEQFRLDRAVELVQGAIRIASISGHEREVGAYFAEQLERRGLMVELQEVAADSVNVIGRLRGDEPGPRLMFQGHIDTVPDYGYADAFSGSVRDGKILGRGACDMKGPLGAVIEAAGLVRELGVPLRGELIVACTADEESQKTGILRLLDSGVTADMAVSVEPTDMRIALAQKGCASIHVTTFGQAGHGSRPEGKANAIRRMASIVAGLDGMDAEIRNLPGIGPVRTTNNVGVISGGRTFMVVPDRCDIWIDHRMLPGQSQADALQRFRRFIGALAAREGFSVEVALDRQDWSWPRLIARGLKGTMISPEERVVRGLGEACWHVLGLVPPYCVQEAWCETDFLVNDAGIPTVNFGPGKMELAHSASEHIDIEQIKQAVQIYALLILIILGEAS
jgi:succinyl-diaminopimelate desuccinylase